MSASQASNSDDKPAKPLNLSEITSSGSESHSSGQNPPEPRRRSSNYASSTQTNSDSKLSNSAQEEQSRTGSHSTVILLLGIAGDTTWRMFVPVLGLTALGIWGDRSFGTKPWLTAGGVVLGTIIAALLVRRQFKKEPKKR